MLYLSVFDNLSVRMLKEPVKLKRVKILAKLTSKNTKIKSSKSNLISEAIKLENKLALDFIMEVYLPFLTLTNFYYLW
jgi:hypothetical protein